MSRPTTLAAGSVAARTWQHLVAALTEDIELLGEEVVAREKVLLPSYSAIRANDLAAVSCDGISGLIPLLAERRVLREDELSLYWSTTARQAETGVVLDDMLQAWHIGLDVLRTWARRRIVADEMPSDVMIDFLEWTIPWMDLGSRATIEYYRRHSGVLPHDDEVARSTFVRQVLGGELPASELIERCSVFGLDPGGMYHALRGRVTDEGGVRGARAWLGLGDAARRARGLIARVDDEVWGFVARLPDAESEMTVGTSGPVAVDALPRAFVFATRALETATSLQLTGCQSIKSLGLHPAIIDDDEVGNGLIERYVAPVEALGGSGCEILVTLRAYLAHQSRYDRAAAGLYVHPNTVRYRVRRYEELTGVTLRDTSSLAAVWWALERHRLVGGA